MTLKEIFPELFGEDQCIENCRDCQYWRSCPLRIMIDLPDHIFKKALEESCQRAFNEYVKKGFSVLQAMSIIDQGKGALINARKKFL